MGEGYGCSNFHITSTQPLQLQLNSYSYMHRKTTSPYMFIAFCTSDKEVFLYIMILNTQVTKEKGLVGLK